MNPTAHQDLAAAYIQINQVDDAVVELKTAIKLSPDSPQLHYDLGTAYKLQDDATDAIPELETAAKLNLRDMRHRTSLGCSTCRWLVIKEAAQQLEELAQAASAKRRRMGDAWECLQQLHRLPEAASALQRHLITCRPVGFASSAGLGAGEAML